MFCVNTDSENEDDQNERRSTGTILIIHLQSSLILPFLETKNDEN